MYIFCIAGCRDKYSRVLNSEWKRLFSHLVFLFILLFNSPFVFSQSAAAIFKDRRPQLISKQFSFTEGPAVDKKGNIFFTDQPNNKIWKYDIHGHLSVFLDSAGRSNGMYFDKKENLITCADDQNQLWSISPKGKVTVLLKDFKGHRLNGPNDLWVDPNGGIYFSDPYFQRDYWQRKSPDSLLGGENLYYLPAGKNEAILVDGPLMKPNGLTGTRDGKFLFVSEMGKGRILKYRILKNGMLSDRKVFVKDLADGITLDENGNLYLAGRGVTVYNSMGNKIEHIDI
ncbi:MAG TPA: SMP-30/gluconolactonase/LRE family protein, partial [Flavisolibacter sp.]|nr:SMP-30/gluconolactonase/LRE family protein [Flavisolibacter sp.]